MSMDWAPRGPLYYNRDGTPILGDGAREWAQAFETEDRRVARTKVTDATDPSKSFDVSTVFLRVDHNFGYDPPLIFETMVFAEGDDMDQAQKRYSTEQEALAGHRAMVARVSARLVDPVVMDTE